MSDATVNTEVDSRGVATVTLNNPDKHNAFDDHIIAQLHEAFVAVDNDDSLRALILAGNGKSFSAGADLSWMQRMVDYTHDENVRDARALADMLRALNKLSKPTIARVQGAAYGGGVGLVSCCDVVFATGRASFCLSEVKIGLAPATISPYVMAAIGTRAARRYFLSAERFDAAQAQKLGLVTELVADDQLDECISAYVDQLLQCSPAAIGVTKKLILDLHNQTIDDGLIQHTSDVIASVRTSEEGQEGLRAFLQKRPPRWQP